MREHSRDRGRLEDILKYARNVEKIVDGISFEEFVADIRTYYSVMKNIEVIGEAANMLTRHFREVHNELPWRLIVNMRNILVHGYAQVSEADLWQTATSDIKPMREQVEQYLAKTNWEQWAQEKDPYTEMGNTAYQQITETARKMKAKGYAVADIADITGLTAEEIIELG